MIQYRTMAIRENTFIGVECFHGNTPVLEHQHKYDELVILKQGTCVYHDSKGSHVLMPNDAFLIPPHVPHSYEIHSDVTIYNCQFYAELFQENWAFSPVLICTGFVSQKFLDSSDRVIDQGIMHLSMEDRMELEHILQKMMDEQTKKDIGYEYMKVGYLNMVLTILARMENQRSKRLDQYSESRRQMMADVLEQIENNYAEEIDFLKIAQNVYLHPNYFRTVFRDFTGLSPIAYLNRVRISRAMELLETDSMQIADVALRVGFVDVNYFSRLFKKVTGATPSAFAKKCVL